MDDFANKITPTSGMAGGGDSNAMSRFYNESCNGIKYANTVLTYVDQVKGLDEKTRNEYKGRAYFHRAYKYYHMVLLFGDIPLITKIISVPKQNYKSTSKEAIFKMLVHDLEFAVANVPRQKDMPYWGPCESGGLQAASHKVLHGGGRIRKGRGYGHRPYRKPWSGSDAPAVRRVCPFRQPRHLGSETQRNVGPSPRAEHRESRQHGDHPSYPQLS